MFTDMSALEFLARESRRRSAADEAARQDLTLRRNAVTLVEKFAHILHEQAAELAYDQGDPSAFNLDRCSESLLWVFDEYLAGSQCNDLCREDTTKHYQLTQLHAMDWFDLDTLSDGTLVPADEPPPAELRRLVVNALHTLDWVEVGMYCNPFTGRCVEKEADLASLLAVITDQDNLKTDETFNLQELITRLTGMPKSECDVLFSDVGPDEPEFI